MTNKQWLIKALIDEDKICAEFLTCKACEYFFTNCETRRCAKGHEKWLNKEHIEHGESDCKKCKHFNKDGEPTLCEVWDRGGRIGAKDCPRFER